jgi:hypothetical protein
MYHENGQVETMKMLCKLNASTLQSIFIVSGVLTNTTKSGELKIKQQQKLLTMTQTQKSTKQDK